MGKSFDTREIERAMAQLQSKLINTDRSRLGGAEFLILKNGHIRLDIYKEIDKHKLPHFHLKFKAIFEASYQIRPLRKLAGDMPAKYERLILNWVQSNQNILEQMWQEINIKGIKPIPIILE